MAALVALTASICAQEAPPANNESQDFFPEGTFWMNADYQLRLENFHNKIVLLVVSDESCVECGYYLDALHRNLQQMPSVQIIELMVGSTTSPISRNHLLHYIQRQGWTHPIGIAPDLLGFVNAKVTEVPFFALYEKGSKPSVTGLREEGFKNVMQRLEEMRTDPELMRSYATYQLQPPLNNDWWANPVVEDPTYIAISESNEGIFVNDAAHKRILAFDDDGMCTVAIGGSNDFREGNLYNARLNHPSGMLNANGNLYIADTYNNRIRKFDLASQSMSTIAGNGGITYTRSKSLEGTFGAIGLPMDIVQWGTSLYVVSGATNQVFEFDPSDGTGAVFSNLPEKMKGHVRVHPVNLAAGTKFLFVVMSDGEILQIDRKGNTQRLSKKETKLFSSVCEWKGGLVAYAPLDKKLYFREKEKWHAMDNTNANEANKGLLPLSYVSDMNVYNGDLLISDTENHLLREMGSVDDKMLKNFWFKLSPELIGYESATAAGETVLMDHIKISAAKTTVKVKLDLQGYQIVNEGQNEASLVEVGTAGVMKSETITSDEIMFTISDFGGYDVYMEVYLTLQHPENPGVFVVKRAYLDIAADKVEEAPSVQEITYRPNLLPH